MKIRNSFSPDPHQRGSIFGLFLKRFYLFFRERGRKGERGGEKHLSAASHPKLGVQACALTWNRTGDLSTHRAVLHPLSHTSQGLLISLQLSSNMYLPGPSVKCRAFQVNRQFALAFVFPALGKTWILVERISHSISLQHHQEESMGEEVEGHRGALPSHLFPSSASQKVESASTGAARLRERPPRGGSSQDGERVCAALLGEGQE